MLLISSHRQDCQLDRKGYGVQPATQPTPLTPDVSVKQAWGMDGAAVCASD